MTSAPANSPTYELTPWGVRMLKRLRPWRARRGQLELAAIAAEEASNHRKAWILPWVHGTSNSPGYEDFISDLNGSPTYSLAHSPVKHYSHVPAAELDSGRDCFYYPSTSGRWSSASPGFSSADTAVPSEVIQYPYPAKRDTISTLGGGLNETHEAPDTSVNEFPAAGVSRRWNTKHVSPLPSLRITTQPENSHVGKVDVEGGIPRLTATLNGPLAYNAECITAAANVSDWLVTLQIDDESGPPSVQVDCGSNPSQKSPSATNGREQWPDSNSPSGQSQTSVFTSEGEASFVLGEHPIVCATLEDSEEFTTLVATFAKAFVSSYLDRTNAATDSPNSPSQNSSASNSSGGVRAGQTSSLATTPTSPNVRPGQKRPAGREDGDGAKRRKLPKVSTSPISPADGKLLACPYAKFDPRRYSERNETEKNYRGCSSCFLKDINRLKQHLYRVHRRPEHHCPCCFAAFECRETLDSHIVERCCERKPSPFEEKMTPDQLTAIKRRDLGRDRSEAWFDIYKILFPGSPVPLNPFVDSVHTATVQGFMAFFEGEGRAVLASEINWRMFGYAQTTPQHQLWVELILTESINVMVRRLDDRLRQSTVLNTPTSSQPA